MFFIFKEEKYEVNVEKLIGKTGVDDYVDGLDVFGIVIHNIFPCNTEEFDNYTLMLTLNNREEIKSEIYDCENDEYHFIDPTIDKNECQILTNFLKCK